MLDVQASPSLPRFAFGKYDEVILDGISYRATDCSDDGYIFVRTDASDVAQSFSHADLSRTARLNIVVTSFFLSKRSGACASRHGSSRLFR